MVTNNGEIEFTYKEAEHRRGIKQGAFLEARDHLIEVGFIDITHSGAGLYKSKTLYGISDRWRKYGTPDFQQVERQKDSRRIGYQKRNARQKERAGGKGWQAIEGVGKPTRRDVKLGEEDVKQTRADGGGSCGPKASGVAASEKAHGESGSRTGKATRLSVGKGMLSSRFEGSG